MLRILKLQKKVMMSLQNVYNLFYLFPLDSKIDGSVFIKLTRADLSDLFPGGENFITRKTMWDIIEDQVSTIYIMNILDKSVNISNVHFVKILSCCSC